MKTGTERKEKKKTELRPLGEQALEDIIRSGEMPIADFFEFIAFKTAYRTHCLDVKSSYVILPHHSRDDIVLFEEIKELDYLEKGDFLTTEGTTGPMRHNVFVRLSKDHFPHQMLIEGDGFPTADGGNVYAKVAKYLQERSQSSVNADKN